MSMRMRLPTPKLALHTVSLGNGGRGAIIIWLGIVATLVEREPITRSDRKMVYGTPLYHPIEDWLMAMFPEARELFSTDPILI